MNISFINEVIFGYKNPARGLMGEQIVLQLMALEIFQLSSTTFSAQEIPEVVASQ